MYICLKVPGVYMCIGSRVKDRLWAPPSVFVFILEEQRGGMLE